MFRHDLKMAFRTLRRYRLQLLISIVGISFDFEAFMSWARFSCGSALDLCVIAR